MTTKEAHILKVQLADDGRVWYANGVETPLSTTQDRAGFVNKLATQVDLHVRVLGTVINAPLIVDLYQKCCSARLTGRLEVASPAVCETTAERHDPTISLYRMRQCLLSPSLGGWHQVDELDYPAYAIAAQFAQDGKFTTHIERLLLTHPAYHDLLFLPTLNRAAVTELLGIVLDPRWFIDIRNPYRLSKLKLYLGLTPRLMRQVSEGRADCELTRRCRLALTAWGGGLEQPTPADYERPGNFLWRRWRVAGGGCMGNLRATQAFVAYLVRTWQQQLVSKSAQTLEMFVPAELLKGDEITAYKAHAKTRIRE